MDDARRVLGTAHVVCSDGYSLDALEGNVCCCAIDAEGTAKALRCYVEEDEAGLITELVPLPEPPQTNEIKEQNAP